MMKMKVRTSLFISIFFAVFMFNVAYAQNMTFEKEQRIDVLREKLPERMKKEYQVNTDCLEFKIYSGTSGCSAGAVRAEVIVSGDEIYVLTEGQKGEGDCELYWPAVITKRVCGLKNRSYTIFSWGQIEISAVTKQN